MKLALKAYYNRDWEFDCGELQASVWYDLRGACFNIALEIEPARGIYTLGFAFLSVGFCLRFYGQAFGK